MTISQRAFADVGKRLVGVVPAIGIVPVADGRTGAYEDNQEKTWVLASSVANLIVNNTFLPNDVPVRVVMAPEIVYGPRTAALAQEKFAKEGVSSGIYVSRSWAYSDELMGAITGIGSSEWQFAAYGLNQTDRPGAVWLKAFTAAMDEKKRPIFSIYNPDLEDENAEFTPYVRERLLRFARCATTVAEMRGKNYLSIGGVSMGIIGSDVRRNMMLDYLGMGAASVDMSIVRGRMDNGFYDHEELELAYKFMDKFKFAWAPIASQKERPLSHRDLLRDSLKMTLIVRDLMIGNPRLADPEVGKKQGFTADVEHAQGNNAIAAGTQGQRAWTDLYPNFDLTEAVLCSSFDWNGYRQPFIVATENDVKNAIGMTVAHLLTGMPQLFADIRTNWTPESIKKATGIWVGTDECPRGLIDKRNSGAGALDYAVDVIDLVRDSTRSGSSSHMTIQQIAQVLRKNVVAQADLMSEVYKRTQFMGANLQYFPGDGLSSHFRTPGRIPMTAYRYNVVGDGFTCSVVEGNTVELPKEVADYISKVTDPTWPETYWTPRDMTSFEYMNRIGPNHDGNSFGLIGADMITLNAMLHIPVDMHNVPEDQIFRPTFWDRRGNAKHTDTDFRACAELGPVYA